MRCLLILFLLPFVVFGSEPTQVPETVTLFQSKHWARIVSDGDAEWRNYGNTDKYRSIPVVTSWAPLTEGRYLVFVLYFTTGHKGDCPDGAGYVLDMYGDVFKKLPCYMHAYTITVSAAGDGIVFGDLGSGDTATYAISLRAWKVVGEERIGRKYDAIDSKRSIFPTTPVGSYTIVDQSRLGTATCRLTVAKDGTFAPLTPWAAAATAPVPGAKPRPLFHQAFWGPPVELPH
jgi:hypothetical protein